jgi:hypothetical protein
MINIAEYLTSNPQLVLIIILWEGLWKGLGLWKAGRRNEPLWFGFIFILNTLGILPIVYLIIRKDRKKIKKR